MKGNQMISVNPASHKLFEPIEQNTMTELVAKQLLDSLSNGSLKPGDKLPAERDLATQFNVGRTTVREALKLLTLSGLLEAKRGAGTYVRQDFSSFLIQQVEWPLLLNAHQVDMVLEVRQPLETQAVVLAAERATQGELETIACFDKLLGIEGRDIELETELDLDFHNAIAEAAHNDLLSSLMSSLQGILRQYIKLANEMTDNLETTYQEHKAIYNAIANRDPVKAKQAMIQHLNISKELIMRAFHNNSTNG
jgi:GntR family transcriptional repressor for pyruvate dehydrogenase complex